ncbi:T9SS C-terminal target domain-containing protein [Hymenobacter oligotrophus]|uniref:T9SS C-terminal target domain-containing protein n=1 Tax=Hymenobacter oligotrophus TaxID=2319843 RepID=A0A3B7R579_9BACT|nr:S8 family serine peptidase [Hymenobacter oligotrophus]AYA38583.1 T9SS C-terminal target domain-containing protein [Hymenobacter oligotrophus]
MKQQYGRGAWKTRRIVASVLAALGGLLATEAAAQPTRATPASRLAPALQAEGAQPARRATYRVQVHDAAGFRQWAQQHLRGAQLRPYPADARVFTVHAPGQLSKLAECPWVTFVDVADREAKPEKEIDGVDLGVNRIWPVHQLYPNLTGQGLTVSIKEDSFNGADIDFKGRVVTSTLFGSSPSDHATVMATLIGGASNSAPTGRGAASRVQLAASNYAQLMPDDAAQLSANKVSVQNHSYGVAAIENYYGLEARAYDQQTRQLPALLHVFSSGNVGNRTPGSGTYAGLAGVANITGQFKTSKNTLCVGATDVLGRVAAPSSRGPAHDGRLKPEMVALGEGGTSDAAAVVSGIAALVQQAYRDEHNGQLPPAALAKAVLLNSADDVGRPGPDFEAGFGQADALGAVQTMLDRRFVQGRVANGATGTFALAVPAGVRQLKLTLAWADPEAAANASKALVNDLDMELVSASGVRVRPWVLSAYPHRDSLKLPARRGVDRLNNVEQITVAAPAAGTYQIQVQGAAVAAGPEQNFAIAYEFENEGLTWTNPVGGTALRAGQLQRLRWQWQGPAATGTLSYRAAGASTWTIIDTNVDLGLGLYAWTAPADAAAGQLRLEVGNTAYPTATFAISQAPLVEVGYVCTQESLLTWEPVPGATRYQVLRLGVNALEPLATTADTALLLNVGGEAAAMQYYSVVPVLADGSAGVRARTVSLAGANNRCYVRSFLPRQLVTDQITFDLVLGSTFRLRAVHLERETPGGFQTVQTVTPGAQPTIELRDQLPEPGLYRYRARLETLAGQTVYSQVENIYYARPGDVLLFPNPVVAGTAATFIEANGLAMRWQLIDHLGRLVREGEAPEASVGQFDTSNLRAGTYIVRITPAGGATVVRRLVVLR